jgi:hypothetical protein
MRVLPLVGFLLALAPPAPAEVTVRVGPDGRVDVKATTAPLPEVLDRFSRQTGMKVIYEGPPPRPLLNLTLEGRTPAQAVLEILEGLGLNYAVVMDATATRVDTLLMAGGASGVIPSPPPAPRASMPIVPRPRGLPAADPTEPPEEETPEEEPAAVPSPAGPGGTPTPAPTLPVITMPSGQPVGPNLTPPSYPVSPFTPRLLPPQFVPAPAPGTSPTPEPTPPP